MFHPTKTDTNHKPHISKMLLHLLSLERDSIVVYLCYYINSYRICTIFHILKHALLRTEFLSTEASIVPTSFIDWLLEEIFVLPNIVETVIF